MMLVCIVQMLIQLTASVCSVRSVCFLRECWHSVVTWKLCLQHHAGRQRGKHQMFWVNPSDNRYRRISVGLAAPTSHRGLTSWDIQSIISVDSSVSRYYVKCNVNIRVRWFSLGHLWTPDESEQKRLFSWLNFFLVTTVFRHGEIGTTAYVYI